MLDLYGLPESGRWRRRVSIVHFGTECLPVGVDGVEYHTQDSWMGFHKDAEKEWVTHGDSLQLLLQIRNKKGISEKNENWRRMLLGLSCKQESRYLHQCRDYRRELEGLEFSPLMGETRGLILPRAVTTFQPNRLPRRWCHTCGLGWSSIFRFGSVGTELPNSTI